MFDFPKENDKITCIHDIFTGKTSLSDKLNA